MKSLMTSFRTTLLTLAAAGAVLPSAVWAKGSIGIAGESASHFRTSTVGRVNTSGAVIKPPPFHPQLAQTTHLDSVNSGQLKSSVVGSVNAGGATTGNGRNSQSNLSSISASEAANKTGIIIVGGKTASTSTIKPGDAVSLNPQPLPPKSAAVSKLTTSGIGIFSTQVNGGGTKLTAGNLKTSTQGKTPIVGGYHTTGLSIGPIDVPSPSDIVDAAADLAKGAVAITPGPGMAGTILNGIKHAVAPDHFGPESTPAPSGGSPLDSNLFTEKTQGKLDTTPLMLRNSKNLQTSVVGGVDKNITPSKMAAAAKTSVDTGLLNIPYTPGKLGTANHVGVDVPMGQLPPMTGGPATNPNAPSQQTSSSGRFPLPFPTSDVGGSGVVQASAQVADSTASPANDPPAGDAQSMRTGVDLVLEDVTLAWPATLVAGPAYTIKFRNQGSQAAGKFQVAILAGMDEKLTDDAPRAVIEVASLAAGEAREVTLRLPQSALRLAVAGEKPVAFTHLFVAVDFVNTIAETDETNNTAVIERAALEGVAAN